MLGTTLLVVQHVASPSPQLAVPSFRAALQLLWSHHSLPRSKEHQTERFGEEEANQPDSHFGPLLLVGEISLVPASTRENKPLLTVPPILAIWQHREIRHATPGWVPACCLLICTHGEVLGGHTGPHSIHQGRQPRTLLLPGVMLLRHVLKEKSKAMTSVSGKRGPDAEWWMTPHSSPAVVSSTFTWGCSPTARAQTAPHKQPPFPGLCCCQAGSHLGGTVSCHGTPEALGYFWPTFPWQQAGRKCFCKLWMRTRPFKNETNH